MGVDRFGAAPGSFEKGSQHRQARPPIDSSTQSILHWRHYPVAFGVKTAYAARCNNASFQAKMERLCLPEAEVIC